ncbi:hypothetical protein ATI02_4328 [Pseudomonas baetica]|uniref:Large polyvalent protein-associated domain-containing protein n=1 Tax=Pseudomonas baetica TaxID=674054 RepID=A0ABX4Q3K2_9PSED|nr:hypothetical protein [Pseudomonas baetica]PKA71350.1 hypothetical protein ATI02_4328 [Pseudomonas baetica]PTC19849.1 hypothetical protein C0J26_07580 [Pseudomonas baetica]
MPIKKEMLVAGNFQTQSFDLVPAKLATPEQIAISERFFKELTDKVKAIDPSLVINYDRFPALTVMKGGETIAVLAHSAPSQRHEYLKSFGCTAALYSGAFLNANTFKQTKQILEIFNVNMNQMKVREDLGNKYELANQCLNNLKNQEFDYVNLANLRDMYVAHTTLANNYLKMRGADKGIFDGDKVHRLSEEHAMLMQDDPTFFKFTSLNDEKLNANLNTLMDSYNERKPATNPDDPAQVSQLNKIAAGIHKELSEQDKKAEIENERLEQYMRELGFMYNQRKKSVYKKYANINQVSICNRYNREMLNFKTGGSDVNINKAAIHDDNALILGVKIAADKGFMPLVIRVSNSAVKLNGEDSCALFVEKTINHALESGKYNIDEIIVPEAWQYMIDMKKEELLNNASLGQANEQDIQAHQSRQEAKASNPTADVASPAVDVSGGSVDVELNDEPGSSSPTPVTSHPDAAATTSAVPSPEPVPVTGGSTATPAANQPSAPVAAQSAPSIPKRPIVMGCYLVASGEHFLLYGVKDNMKVNDDKTMKRVINKLCDLEGITVDKVHGCWYTAVPRPLLTLAEIKKLEAEMTIGMDDAQEKQFMKDMKRTHSFKLAHDSLKDLKAIALEAAVVVPKPSPFLEVSMDEPNTVTPPVAGPVPTTGPVEAETRTPVNVVVEGGFDAFDLPTTEKFMNDLLGLNMIDSPMYKALQEARATGKVERDEPVNEVKDVGKKLVDDGIDYTSALKDVEKVDKDKQETVAVLKNAMANKKSNTIKESI